MNAWSKTSSRKLDTCHQDLQVLANAVLFVHDCQVITGHRDEATQNRMVAEGKSTKRWPDGKHNSSPSEAIDLVPYRKDEDPWEYKYSLYFAGLVLGFAEQLHAQGMMQYRIRWGGNWSSQRDAKRDFKDVSFYDGLHFELSK